MAARIINNKLNEKKIMIKNMTNEELIEETEKSLEEFKKLLLP